MRDVTLAALLLIAPPVMAGPEPWGFADYKALPSRIRQGCGADVLALAEAEVAVSPDSWYGNVVRADALAALKRPDEAQAGLVRWADRNRADQERIEVLIEFARRNERWTDLPAIVQRIDLLSDEARRGLLRSVLDLLYEAGDAELAVHVVRELVPLASDPELATILRALEAATRGDINAMLKEVAAFPDRERAPEVRDEALVLVSRRAAYALRPRPDEGSSERSLPPTGAVPKEQLTSPVKSSQLAGPIYPTVAQRTRTEGKLLLRVLVLPSGESLVSGVLAAPDPAFIGPAAEDVARRRYEPGRVGDAAVMTEFPANFTFTHR